MVTVTLLPLYPREGTPLRFEQEAGWTSESDWTFWRREVSCFHRNSSPGPSASIPDLGHKTVVKVTVPSAIRLLTICITWSHVLFTLTLRMRQNWSPKCQVSPLSLPNWKPVSTLTLVLNVKGIEPWDDVFKEARNFVYQFVSAFEYVISWLANKFPGTCRLHNV